VPLDVEPPPTYPPPPFFVFILSAIKLNHICPFREGLTDHFVELFPSRVSPELVTGRGQPIGYGNDVLTVVCGGLLKNFSS
jgi:hypothetical protein